jgi:hypothetical protein
VQLAAAIGVSESRIYEYMAGKRQPTPEGWLALGKLALEYKLADPFFFWALAGVDTETLRLMADRVQERRYEFTGPTVPIPRFRETVQGREEAGPPIPLPAEFIPNPNSTVCLVVDYKATAVVDSPRAVFILDESEADAENLLLFWDQVIFIRHKPKNEEGLQAPPGIYMGRIKLLLLNTPTARMTFSGMVRLTLVFGQSAPSPLRLAYFEYPFPADLAADLAGIDLDLDELAHDPRVSTACGEARQRARSEVRLDPDWHILGRVLGRLKVEGAKNG